MNNSFLLKNIESLKQTAFKIPYYQRGYRWKQEQVKQLIDDIDSFHPTNEHPFYFMQVLAVAENTDDGLIHVIDGQQRLTTISLLLAFFKSPEYLKLSYDREAKQAIDDFFINKANNTINESLGNKTILELEIFKRKLLQASFLYYVVDASQELELFSDLNSGKIPAKDSELIKCILTTPLLDEESSITRSRANEWDAIERELNDDDLFAMIASKKLPLREDRMTILLRWANIVPTQQFFSDRFPFLKAVQEAIWASSRQAVWQKIYMAFYRLKSWYKDSKNYHLVGWFVNKDNVSNVNLKYPSLKSMCESAQKVLVDCDNANYANQPLAHRLLLLFNAAYCWQRGIRLNFNAIQKVPSWSLEHIFARNQKDLDESTFKEWFPNTNNEQFNDYCKANDKCQWLANILGECYPEEQVDDSLGNLALLGKNTNSALNNKLFRSKQKELFYHPTDYLRGDYEYVLPATLAVFGKMLPGMDLEHSYYWSKADRNAYVDNIKATIDSFLKAFIDINEEAR